MARRLAGKHGVVLETDEYFYTQVGEDPAKYDYSDGLLPVARQWNFERFCGAIASAMSPIVVDRGNGLNPVAITLSAANLVFTASVPVRCGLHSRPKLRELEALQRIARRADAPRGRPET